jgi:hypothetical protein
VATIPPVQPISADGYEPVSAFGAVLISALQPWLTLHMAWFLDAIGVMVDPVYTLVYDQGVDDGTMPTVGTYVGDTLVAAGEGYQPGYASALDPQQATAGYGFLGQIVGVQLPTGVDDETAKSLVTAEAGMSRATPAAVIAAAKRNLSGSQSVTLLERTYIDGTPDAGWFVLVVRPEQIINEAALIASVNAVKLGGLMWSLVQTDSWTISEMEADYSTISELEAAFPTITALEEGPL